MSDIFTHVLDLFDKLLDWDEIIEGDELDARILPVVGKRSPRCDDDFRPIICRMLNSDVLSNQWRGRKHAPVSPGGANQVFNNGVTTYAIAASHKGDLVLERHHVEKRRMVLSRICMSSEDNGVVGSAVVSEMGSEQRHLFADTRNNSTEHGDPKFRKLLRLLHYFGMPSVFHWSRNGHDGPEQGTDIYAFEIYWQDTIGLSRNRFSSLIQR